MNILKFHVSSKYFRPWFFVQGYYDFPKMFLSQFVYCLN